MKWSMRSLIASLRADATDPYQNLVPDGVADLSEIINPLVGIASTGRVVNEFEEYNLGRFGATLLERLLPMPRPTISDLQNAVLTLLTVLIAVLREVVAIKPDVSIDEVLSGALSDEKVRNLQDEFKVVPFNSAAGRVQLLFGIMQIFSRPIPRTVQSILGPSFRKLGKLDFFIRRELGELHPDVDGEDGDEPEDGWTDDDWGDEGLDDDD